MENTTDQSQGSLENDPDENGIWLSVIVPIYNEYDNINPLVENLYAVLPGLGRPFQIILVDDGSSDESAETIAAVEAKHSEIIGVYLARNYGQSTAMQAGFDAADGQFVITLDGDLQNDPQDIPALLKEIEEKDVDVVSGWRQARQDGGVRMMFSRVANKLISRVTEVPVRDFGCTLRVYRRDLLERTRLYGELHRFLPALLVEAGAKIIEVPVRHHPRRAGVSKYKLDRTFRVFLDLILIVFFRHYIQRPLHVFGGIGLAFSISGSLILAYLGSIRLIAGISIGGRPLLTLGVLLLLMGIMFIGQGLLGELVSRIFIDSGQRTQYHLRRRTKKTPPPTQRNKT